MKAAGTAPRAWQAVLREALACVVRPTSAGGALHVHGGVGIDARHLQIVIASLPAVVVSLAATGSAGAEAAGTAAGPGFWLPSFAAGLQQSLALLLLCLSLCLCWEVVFARLLGRAADAGWLVTAWLLAALLPPSLPLAAAAVAISFGAVFGAHVFGGTGRYLVSPALLGAVFAYVAYPAQIAAAGPAGIDVPFALASGLGGVLLAVRGTASWRTLAGGVLGALLAGAVFGQAEVEPERAVWYGHLATGSFAFGLAFIATDPTTLPLTRAARWLHGLTIGVLSVLIRTANPQLHDAVVYVLLLAALFVPLFDHVVVALCMRALRSGARR